MPNLSKQSIAATALCPFAEIAPEIFGKESYIFDEKILQTLRDLQPLVLHIAILN